MKNFKPIKPATVKVVAHTRKAPTRSNTKKLVSAKSVKTTNARKTGYSAKNKVNPVRKASITTPTKKLSSPNTTKPIVVNDTKNVIKNTEKSSSGSRSTVNWRTNHKAAINKQAEVQVFHDKVMSDPSSSFAEKQRAIARLNEATDAVQGTAPTQAQDSQFKQEAKHKQAKAGAYMLGGGAVLGVAERNNKRNNDADIAVSEQMANAMKGW